MPQQEQPQQNAGLPSATVLPFIIAAFVILVFIAFGASISYGFITLDDPYLIVTNLAVRGITFENLHRIFTTFDPELYIPLTFLSYQINYLMTGLDASSFHVTNLLLHAANAILVGWLLLLLTKKRWMALIAGLLFAVHPIHTEAVVWAAGRKDLLSALFYLLAFIGYLKSREGGSRAWYFGSIAFFLLGLLSKVMVLTLPLTLLLFEALLTDRRRDWKMLKDKIPYFASALVLAIIALFGKQRVVSSSTLLETLLMACKSSLFYLQKLFLPMNLSVFYPHEGAIGLSIPAFFIPLFLVLAISIAVVMLRKRFAWIPFCWFFYLITLAPTFLNFHKGEVMFFAVDRYAYLPSIAIILLVLLAVDCALRTKYGALGERKGQRTMLGAMQILPPLLAGILIVSFIWLARVQTRVWANDERLYSHALSLYPSSVSARSSLAMLYQQGGRLDQALAVLKAGLAHKPDVSLYTGIGSIYAAQRKQAEAEAQYRLGMALDAKNPEPHFFLGSLRESQDKVDDAINEYQQAIALDDSYVGAHNNLAAIYQERGELAEAEIHFRRALSYNPDFFEGQYNLFQVLELQKKYDEAFPYLERAYALNPDDVDILMSIIYRFADRGRNDDAAAAAEHALQLFPDNPSVKRMIEYLREKGISVQKV